MFVGLHGPVPAQDPNDVGVGITSAEELAIRGGILGREEHRPRARAEVPLIAPRRQHPDRQAQHVRAGDDPVYVLEVALDGLCQVIVPQRQIAVGVGDVKPVFG